MNPIASYIRHLIVTLIVLLLVKFKFPLEGADAFADSLSLFVVATLTWAIVKYMPDLAKSIGLLSLLLACLILLPSCVTTEGTITAPDGTTTHYKTTSPDPEVAKALAEAGADAVLSRVIPEK